MEMTRPVHGPNVSIPYWLGSKLRAQRANTPWKDWGQESFNPLLVGV
jgi:hypothetical protein